MRKVAFKIPSQKLSHFSKEYQQYRALCQEVFGIDLPQSRGYNGSGSTPDVKITCWADQFAEFIVLRHQLGMQNQFAFLEPVLIPCLKEPRVNNFTFDVTKGEAR